MRYQVNVTRDGRWWMLKVPEIDGLTQARRLGEVELMARELIAVSTGAELDDVEVEVHLADIGAVTADRMSRLARERSAAAERDAYIASETRALAAGLVEAGVPMRDVGKILHVSHQRVQQLVKAC